MAAVRGRRRGRVRGRQRGVSRGVAVTWTVDALSGKALPANASEWNDFRSAYGLAVSNPTLLWNMQDASGGAAASIGAINLDPEAPGTRIDYQQSVAGWTRKAILSRGDALLSSAAGLPDPATTSVLLLGVMVVEAPAAANDRITIGTVNRALLQVTSTPQIQVVNSANIAAGASTINGAAHPYLLRFNQTADTVAAISDLEVVSVAKLVDPDKAISFVGAPTGSGHAYYLYGAMWQGAAAEISNAAADALITAMGW